MSKAIAEQFEMTLWDKSTLPAADSKLAGVLRLKLGKPDEDGRASERLSVLPMSSKDGPSIKSVTGYTGLALKAATRSHKDELKNWLVQQAVKLQGDSHFTGGSLSVSKSGNRVALVFTRCEGITVEKATTDELCARLGITVAQAEALRQENEQKELLDNGHTNGEAILVPAAEPAPAPEPPKPAAKTPPKPAAKK